MIFEPSQLPAERLNLTLLSLFAGIALVLAIVGIYGVMSYSVTQRTHEIGIRMAIGASRVDVFKMILSHGMKLTLIGVGVGLVLAFGLTRLMATMLFGVEPTDATTFASIAVLLVRSHCWHVIYQGAARQRSSQQSRSDTNRSSVLGPQASSPASYPRGAFGP